MSGRSNAHDLPPVTRLTGMIVTKERELKKRTAKSL
jgi:hypothetical protein